MNDYYNLESLTSAIHTALCGVMPEWAALTIEGIIVGVIIILLYAALAVVMIYMERKVCAAFQCRLGPNRVGGKRRSAAGAGRRAEDAHQGNLYSGTCGQIPLCA